MTPSRLDPPPPAPVQTGPSPAGHRAPPVSWRQAGGWCVAALAAVLVTLTVVDNFVVVELRLPLGAVTARLGWIVVIVGAVAFGAGLVAGRLSRRPGAVGSRRWRSDPSAGV